MKTTKFFHNPLFRYIPIGIMNCLFLGSIVVLYLIFNHTNSLYGIRIDIPTIKIATTGTAVCIFMIQTWMTISGLKDIKRSDPKYGIFEYILLMIFFPSITFGLLLYTCSVFTSLI